jgi:hypothetical protein
MGAREAIANQADDAIRAALIARLREAYTHAQRTELLTTALYREAVDLVDVLEGADREDEAADQPPLPAGLTLAQAMDGRALGRILATGVDPRLLSVPLPRDVDLPGDAPGDVLYEAGSAAEALGFALREWTATAVVDPSLS